MSSQHDSIRSSAIVSHWVISYAIYACQFYTIRWRISCSSLVLAIYNDGMDRLRSHNCKQLHNIQRIIHKFKRTNRECQLWYPYVPCSADSSRCSTGLTNWHIAILPVVHDMFKYSLLLSQCQSTTVY